MITVNMIISDIYILDQHQMIMIPIILIIIDRSDQHHIHWEPGKEVWQGKWRPGWVSLFCIHLNFFFVLDLFCIHSHWFPFSREWVWQSLKEMYQWELLCRSRWTFTFRILIFLHWAVMSHDHPHDYDDVKGNQNQKITLILLIIIAIVKMIIFEGCQGEQGEGGDKQARRGWEHG